MLVTKNSPFYPVVHEFLSKKDEFIQKELQKGSLTPLMQKIEQLKTKLEDDEQIQKCSQASIKLNECKTEIVELEIKIITLKQINIIDRPTKMVEIKNLIETNNKLKRLNNKLLEKETILTQLAKEKTQAEIQYLKAKCGEEITREKLIPKKLKLELGIREVFFKNYLSIRKEKLENLTVNPPLEDLSFDQTLQNLTIGHLSLENLKSLAKETVDKLVSPSICDCSLAV